MDLTRVAHEEFQERMGRFESLAREIESAAEDRLGAHKNTASWEDVRVLGDIIDILEEAVQRIADL